jgi:ethanolamine transporter EutH
MKLRRATEIRTDRNPFELWTVVACVFTGVIGLLAPTTRQGVISDILPNWMATVWYVGILVSGGVCVFGTLIPLGEQPLQRVGTRLGVERVGLTILGGLLAGYGFALEILAPINPTGILLISLALACVGRIRQVRREVVVISQLTTRLQDREVES